MALPPARAITTPKTHINWDAIRRGVMFCSNIDMIVNATLFHMTAVEEASLWNTFIIAII